jgi:hypothetical protein
MSALEPTAAFTPANITWPSNVCARFTKETLVVEHDLHTRPMFSNAGLASLLDRYPRDKLGVFTMGSDPVDWRSWCVGRAGDLSGEQLLASVEQGRIWLNLRAANHYLEDYAALSDEIFANKESQIKGLKTLKHDLGVLISSPNAQVFYHLDSALVSLWQIRGTKLVRVYDPAPPFARPEQIEAVILRESAEQLPFDPAWDKQARAVTLEPGMMVTWPQNAPHRIVNGPMMNVSLSLEFMTPQALLRANVIYANGVLRRRFGMTPQIQKGLDPRALSKFGLARAFKALNLQKAHEYKLPVSFDLTQAIPPPITLTEAA